MYMVADKAKAQELWATRDFFQERKITSLDQLSHKECNDLGKRLWIIIEGNRRSLASIAPTGMFLKKNIEEQYTKMDFLAEFEEFIDSQVEAKVTIEQFFDAFENTITKSQQAIFADVINAQDSSKA